MPPTPRFDGRRFLITYSQVNISVEVNTVTLADFLYGLKPQPSYVGVNEEQHLDGGAHFHAVVTFPSRFRGTFFAFDFGGYHPNIKTIKNSKRDLERSIDYIVKDGTQLYITRGEVPVFLTPPARYSWGDLLACETQAEFIQSCADNFPKEFVLRHFDILAFAQQHYNSPSDYVSPYEHDSFVIPTEIDSWVAEVFGEVGTSRSLVSLPIANYLLVSTKYDYTST